MPGRAVAAAFAGLLLALALWPVSAIAGPRLTVVELYTSQGCPLCPPAEVYLGELAQRGDLLPLAFHVDYWDHLGWSDRFAEPAFSRRQQRYSDQLGLPYVYTPQIVVDGHLQVSGSHLDEVEAEIESVHADEGAVEVTLTRLSPVRLRIQIPAAALEEGGADVILVGFDERHETEIVGGENSGMTQVNHHVVRAAKSIASWNGDRFDLTVPLDADHDGTDYCAVLVQRHGQGRIIGAAKIDMRVPGPKPADKG